MNLEQFQNEQYKKSIFLQNCLGKKTGKTPIWLMRQAGRYLTEYREIRKQAGSFMNLVKNIELATEVSLQPIRRFNLDAVILFSDILTIPDAMNLGLNFIEGEGPKFLKPLKTEAEILNLQVPDMHKLNFVFETVKNIKEELNNSDKNIPLIGFAGSPWTLACYMIEGEGSRDFRQTKTLLYSRPDLFHKILEINAESIVQYLNLQIEAGADVIMIFDSWGGILADNVVEEFSLNYIQKILKSLNKLKPEIPKIVFSKGTNLNYLKNLDCRVLGLDWTKNLLEAKNIFKNSENYKKTIQGNLDPNILFSSTKTIEKEAKFILDNFKNESFIFNLGHGINQHTNPDNVLALVEFVHNYQK